MVYDVVYGDGLKQVNLVTRTIPYLSWAGLNLARNSSYVNHQVRDHGV